ncbi:MAG: hypothetical protein O6826_08590 [Acidobacteria bacterium]|nr:hypothetical protein [Acidobacteriota bacterium]
MTARSRPARVFWQAVDCPALLPALVVPITAWSPGLVERSEKEKPDNRYGHYNGNQAATSLGTHSGFDFHKRIEHEKLSAGGRVK